MTRHTAYLNLLEPVPGTNQY